MSANSAIRPKRAAAALAGWIARIDDASLLRTVFYGLLAGVIVTVFLDYRAMALENREFSPTIDRPVLPPATSDDKGSGADAPAVATPAQQLREKIRFTLDKGGVLKLQGTIEPGSAQRFNAEIDRIGEYVTRIELNSPGGSVEDALQIGGKVRERGYETHVADGRLCASSCPLILAGGSSRTAAPGAAIGVHQVFSVSGDAVSSGAAVASAQQITARINRHLSESGVDPAMWLHALDTPPDRLYYFGREELESYRLVSE